MSFFSYKKQTLYCEGLSIKELCKNKETPFYLYSTESIKNNFLLLESKLKGTRNLIAYAVKANSNIAILRLLANCGSGADVVSIGELKKANMAGIPYNKIVYSGVGKKDEEISYAINAGIMQFNVESYDELKKIAQIAKASQKIANIAIRVNPDVAAGGHPKISTGKKYDKFGVSIEEAIKGYKYAKADNGLKIVGIDMHIGSQILDVNPFKNAFEKIIKYTENIESLGIKIENIDLGGGVGIDYTGDKKPNLISDYSKLIMSVYKKLNKRIIIEPGRFLVGDSGILVTKVIFKKTNQQKNFLIVDAGMNDFMRPALYGAKHKIKKVDLEKRNFKKSKFDIVGPICETADTFSENVSFNDNTKPGELLYIEKVGAYGSVMSSYYNTRGSIEEILVDKKRYQTIRKKVSINEIIEKEEIPTWLS